MIQNHRKASGALGFPALIRDFPSQSRNNMPGWLPKLGIHNVNGREMFETIDALRLSLCPILNDHRMSRTDFRGFTSWAKCRGAYPPHSAPIHLSGIRTFFFIV